MAKAPGKGKKAKTTGAEGGDFSYEELKSLCELGLNQKTGVARLDYWQDYHAQLVMVGKYFCRTRAPRCEPCPLKSLLPKD